MVKISGCLFIGSALAFAAAGYLGDVRFLYLVSGAFLLLGSMQLRRPDQNG
ncbi:hypothetical protein [Pseudoalteromonas sp. BDTF-M6]|uniref:hypothetical protein n=1 Tax=Pseudoalteromonas sp. BDTF-M6 TaxID=2796132 RepID=UPI001BB0BBB4|nr:hypothetical protein [Pseudoalteromonas sp. BDTF-M6]MBS3797567.1 hypothetical protein [Pseudoalteromonas sp. BDTF-M6]